MSPESRPDLATVSARVADVQGWMSPGQASTLYEAAAGCPDGGTIVEIGSFQGRSTIVLASAAAADVAVVAIDPHAGNDRGPQEYDGFEDAAADDHDTFIANLERAGVRDRVRHVRMFSDAALGEVDGSIDVLYIDGAHRYAPAREDIRDWGARVGGGRSRCRPWCTRRQRRSSARPVAVVPEEPRPEAGAHIGARQGARTSRAASARVAVLGVSSPS